MGQGWGGVGQGWGGVGGVGGVRECERMTGMHSLMALQYVWSPQSQLPTWVDMFGSVHQKQQSTLHMHACIVVIKAKCMRMLL